MNDLLQKLADQCRTEYRDGHGGFIEQFDEEKFAKLIIQECIDCINRVGILEDIEFQSGMIAQNVREHFGVEGSFRDEIL